MTRSFKLKLQSDKASNWNLIYMCVNNTEMYIIIFVLHLEVEANDIRIHIVQFERVDMAFYHIYWINVPTAYAFSRALQSHYYCVVCYSLPLHQYKSRNRRKFGSFSSAVACHCSITHMRQVGWMCVCVCVLVRLVVQIDTQRPYPFIYAVQRISIRSLSGALHSKCFVTAIIGRLAFCTLKLTDFTRTRRTYKGRQPTLAFVPYIQSSCAIVVSSFYFGSRNRVLVYVFIFCALIGSDTHWNIHISRDASVFESTSLVEWTRKREKNVMCLSVRWAFPVYSLQPAVFFFLRVQIVRWSSSGCRYPQRMGVWCVRYMRMRLEVCYLIWVSAY